MSNRVYGCPYCKVWVISYIFCEDSSVTTIQQRLQQASDARAQEVVGGEVLYSGDANLTDEQIAKLPFALYRQGYEYNWKTYAHPNSTFKYTTSSLLDLMNLNLT